MLKNISKVGTVLSKSEQLALHGGGKVKGCYQRSDKCCQPFTNFVSCDAGRCESNGYCLFY